MFNRQKIKLAVLLCLLVVTGIVSGVLICQDYQYCMNVLLINEADLDPYTEDPNIDITDLLFNGEKVAADQQSGTLYISQPADKLVHSSELVGALESSYAEKSVYFIKDGAVKDPANAVRSGQPLRLAIVKANTYRIVDVVITTLPVLRLEYIQTQKNKDGESVMAGNFVLWGSYTSSEKDYQVASGMTQWHLRGGVSRLQPKKSWKLSLKDANGENKNQDLLGLGSDDDWILNAMSMDDSKVRDQVTMELWNRYIASAEDHPMSSGAYAEVVIDNVYQGLYLLTRRIDTKYLQLDPQKDILLKGTSWTATSIEEGYEIVSSPYSDAETYQIVRDVRSHSAGSSVSVENFVKTNVFINYFAAEDNAGYKNMFYVLQPADDGYRMQFVPWDMDMSMGVAYLDDVGITYDYAESMSRIPNRIEYGLMQEQHQQLPQMMADYWEKYRTSIYSEDTLNNLISAHIAVLYNSGAFARDGQKWGYLYDGKDTHEALYQWCRERLSKMDTYFGQP